MNILIVAEKSDAKIYESIIKTAPNATALGAVCSINSDFIQQIKDRYNPHAILIDTDVRCKNVQLLQTVNDIARYYPYIKIIIITSSSDNNDYPATVVRGQISNIELKNIIKELNTSQRNDYVNYQIDKLSTVSNETTEKLNTTSPAFSAVNVAPVTAPIRSTKIKAKQKINPMLLLIIGAVVFVSLISVLVVAKLNSTQPDDVLSISTVDETATAVSSSAVPTTTQAITTEPVTTVNQPPSTASANKNKAEINSASSSVKQSSKADDDNDNTSSEAVKQSNSNTEKEYDNNEIRDNSGDDEIYYGASVSYGDDEYSNNNNNDIYSVKLSYNSKTLHVGDTLTISATVNPSSASQKVTWQSSNTSVLTVNSSGRVKALKQGSAKITATAANGVSASCSFTVKLQEAAAVKLSSSSCLLSVGQTKTLTLHNVSSVMWSSSNSSVVQISSTSSNNAVIKALRKGSANVTVLDTSTNISYMCKVTVS